jgi:hypothetical protein
MDPLDRFFGNRVIPEDAFSVPEDAPSTPMDTQVGGGHYKSMTIQPIEYIFANKLGYCEANVVKYISRWRDKGGKKDLEKAKHYIDILIQLENL